MWNVPEPTPKGLSHYFFPLQLHLSPPESCVPGTPLPAEVPRRLHSQEGSFSWGPRPRGSGSLVTLPWSSWPDGRVTVIRVTGQARRSGVRGSQCRAECRPGRHCESSLGTRIYSGSRDRKASQVREAGGSTLGITSF